MRIAVMKALPSVEEFTASNCKNAGEYMDWLLSVDEVHTSYILHLTSYIV